MVPVGIFLGLVFQLVGAGSNNLMFLSIGVVLTLGGCALYARSKGRSALWSLITLLFPMLGVFVLVMLEDRSRPARYY